MLSALTGAILPAVADDSHASEQAQLLMAHLNALRIQSDHIEEFERLEHLHARKLATDLTAAAEGGPVSSGAAQHLRSLLSAPVPRTISDTRVVQCALLEAIADFLSAQNVDGAEKSVNESTLAVLDSEYEQSLRDRTLFAPFGYDPNDPRFSSIERMMCDFRSMYPQEEAGNS
jgi:hypothetical protein